MGSVPWRESATLILVSGARTLKTLLLERRAGGSFSKSRVFPGGVVDQADVSTKWQDHFQSFSCSFDKILLPESAKRPPILRARPGELPREVSLRITAIRETFEESGLLLADPMQNVQAAMPELPSWRTRIMKDGGLFLEMCRELKICPDINALKLWSDWLTPIDVPGKRFDAMFFVAEGNEAIQVDVHKDEMVNAVWMAPLDAIAGLVNGSLRLAPPQMYELTRLLNFRTAQELVDFADQRQKYGVEFTFPVRIKCADGIVSIFPGDDGYPSEPDVLAKSPILTSAETCANLRKDVKHLHRFESDVKDRVKWFYQNITLQPEHCDPVNVYTNPTVMAKLGMKMLFSKVKPTFT